MPDTHPTLVAIHVPAHPLYYIQTHVIVNAYAIAQCPYMCPVAPITTHSRRESINTSLPIGVEQFLFQIKIQDILSPQNLLVLVPLNPCLPKSLNKTGNEMFKVVRGWGSD